MAKDYRVDIKCRNIANMLPKDFLASLTSGDLRELLEEIQKLEVRVQAELKNASSDKNRR